MWSMTLRRQDTVIVTFVPEVYIQKQFSKNMFMSIIPVHLKKNVHFKGLQLFVVTFDMSCLRRAIHVV